MNESEPVIVARVARAHGIRGALLLEAETDHAEALFQPGRRLLVVQGGADRPPGTFTISAARPHSGRWLVEIDEAEDRTQAESYRGTRLAVTRDELPDLAESGYLLHDLVGMTVLEAGRPLGAVLDVYDQPGAPLLAVEIGGRERLIPFLEDLVQRVDVETRELHVTLPAGLLDI